MAEPIELPFCPFIKGMEAGIRCDKVIIAEMGRGIFKKICGDLECAYRG